MKSEAIYRLYQLTKIDIKLLHERAKKSRLSSQDLYDFFSVTGKFPSDLAEGLIAAIGIRTFIYNWQCGVFIKEKMLEDKLLGGVIQPKNTMEKVTIGRIVEFFPSGVEGDLVLPNGMKSAPAMVVQVFGEHVNLNVFTADPDGNPVKQAWSVRHKSDAAPEGEKCWEWPTRE